MELLRNVVGTIRDSGAGAIGEGGICGESGTKGEGTIEGVEI